MFNPILHIIRKKITSGLELYIYQIKILSTYYVIILSYKLLLHVKIVLNQISIIHRINL